MTSKNLTNTLSPTIWLIGDSTVCNYPRRSYPQMGWGQMLHRYCQADVKIENHASGGRSTKSFLAEKRWAKVLEGMKEGDFLMIQFGHNDQKENKPAVYAPADTLYQELLIKFITEAREKGVSTVLVTSICRRDFDKEGKINNSLGKYPEAMKAVAQKMGVPIIDLNAISLQKFNSLGPEKTKKIFLHLDPEKYKNFPKGSTDNSHFHRNGAIVIAGWIVAEAKKQNIAICKLLKECE